MIKKVATGITWILSPLLIPTYTTLLILYTQFHFAMLSWPARRFLLIVIILSTAIMPALTLLISRAGLGRHTGKQHPMWVSLMFIALYYNLGVYVLNKLPLYSIFKVMLLTGSFVIVAIILLSAWKKLNILMTALGAVFGMVTALSLRIGANPIQLLTLIALLAGVAGMAVLIKKDNTLDETVTGFPVGALVSFTALFFL